ncbi:hypothetical protein [Mucilaginibacter sp.]
MKIFLSLFLAVVLFSSFQIADNLSGTWEYAGDITNGKKEAAPTEYSLQRKYTSTNYEAFVLEKGYQPEKYETGDYTLKNDSCLETQTWCGQPSNLLNITIHYHYNITNDTLILTGFLPNGTSVEEYWKKVK